MLQENFRDSKHKVWIGVLGGLFFAAKQSFNRSGFFVLKELNEISTLPNDILLEDFIDKWLVEGLTLALDNNSLE